jgi:hypothetical protein
VRRSCRDPESRERPGCIVVPGRALQPIPVACPNRWVSVTGARLTRSAWSIHRTIPRGVSTRRLLVEMPFHVGLQNRNARFDSSVPRFGLTPGFRGFWLFRADRGMMASQAAIRIDPLESARIWSVRSLERSPEHRSRSDS